MPQQEHASAAKHHLIIHSSHPQFRAIRNGWHAWTDLHHGPFSGKRITMQDTDKSLFFLYDTPHWPDVGESRKLLDLLETRAKGDR